jgi:hypothetical protein
MEIRHIVTILAFDAIAFAFANLFCHTPHLVEMAPVQIAFPRGGARERIAELIALLRLPGTAPFWMAP